MKKRRFLKTIRTGKAVRTININNLYQYDDTIWDGIAGELPEGFDADTMQSVLMERVGLCTPIYTDPDTFKNITTLWFRSHKWNLAHLLYLAQAEYDPLQNYDRTEIRSSTRNRQNSGSSQVINTENSKGTSNLKSQPGVTRTQEEQVSPFDSETYKPDRKQTVGTTGIDNSDTTNTMDSNGQTNTETQGNEVEGYEDLFRSYGDIGVDTTMDMFRKELSLVKLFNLYDTVAEMFRADMCLRIW